MDKDTIFDIDSNILVSILNLKLRDFYVSLTDFCEDIEVDKIKLEEKLNKAGYQYKSEINQFK